MNRLVSHKNLGQCVVTDACNLMQATNPDNSSMYVEHDGELKEVSKHLVVELEMPERIRRFKFVKARFVDIAVRECIDKEITEHAGMRNPFIGLSQNAQGTLIELHFEPGI